MKPVKDSLDQDISVGDTVTWASKNRHSGANRIFRGEVYRIVSDKKGTRVSVKFERNGSPRWATISNFAQTMIVDVHT